jgi:hypothetical protein
LGLEGAAVVAFNRDHNKYRMRGRTETVCRPAHSGGALNKQKQRPCPSTGAQSHPLLRASLGMIGLCETAAGHLSAGQIRLTSFSAGHLRHHGVPERAGFDAS